MDIRTKYEIGSIVYAVHPCKLVCGCQVVLNGEAIGMKLGGDNQGQVYAEDIYIVSPHEVRNITVSCNKSQETDIQYELSNGVTREEGDLFASFEEAAGYAVSLYGESSGGYGVQEENGRNCRLKEIVCQKLQQALKAVLSYEQLERFGEEFEKATQGMVFKEA